MTYTKLWGCLALGLSLVGQLASAQDRIVRTQVKTMRPLTRGYDISSFQEEFAIRPVSHLEQEEVVPASVECANHNSCTQCVQGCCDQCDPFWKHRHRVFGDYLYLSAADADLNYATPVNALGTQGTPTGAASFVTPEFQSGFRVGGGFAINDCSSVVATFWNFQSEDADFRQINPTPTGTTQFLNPVLIDPATINVAIESSRAQAFYDIDFRMVDLAYERLVSSSCSHAVNLVLGARYGQLEQELRANYSILGGTMIRSDIDFDGIGPRLGLDGKWQIANGFFAYGQGVSNFLVGNFKADFQQNNTFAGVQSQTTFEDDRIVSLLELDLGLGWQSECGTFSLRGGYYVSSWFNTLTMSGLIDGVQSRQFNDISDSITFHGLTTRLEMKF